MLIIPFFSFSAQKKTLYFPKGIFCNLPGQYYEHFFHPRIPLCFVDINTVYFRRTLYHIMTLYLYICAVLRCESWDTWTTLSFSAVYKEFVTQLTELPHFPSLLFNHNVKTVLQGLWTVYLKSELFNMHLHLLQKFSSNFSGMACQMHFPFQRFICRSSGEG